MFSLPPITGFASGSANCRALPRAHQPKALPFGEESDPALTPNQPFPQASGLPTPHNGLQINSAKGDSESSGLIDGHDSEQSERYHQKLKTLAKYPAHASQSFPFRVNGYDSLSIAGQDSWLTRFLPKSRTGDKDRDHKVNAARQQVAGLIKLSADSSLDVGRDSMNGGLFGLLVGSLVALVNSHLIVSAWRNQKLLSWMMIAGFPLGAMAIGAIGGAIISARHQWKKLGELARNAMLFD